MLDILLKLNWGYEELEEIVNEIHSYSGELENIYYYDNDEDFFDTFYSNNPQELARAIFYGDYNFTDEKIRINVYENIESVSQWKHEKILQENIKEIIELYIEYYDELDTSFTLEEKIESCENITIAEYKMIQKKKLF